MINYYTNSVFTKIIKNLGLFFKFVFDFIFQTAFGIKVLWKAKYISILSLDKINRFKIKIWPSRSINLMYLGNYCGQILNQKMKCYPLHSWFFRGNWLGCIIFLKEYFVRLNVWLISSKSIVYVVKILLLQF